MKIIITSFLLIVVLYYLYKSLKTDKEQFSNKIVDNTTVKFMTSMETKEFILRDPDTYVYNLSQWDLIARKVDSTDTYKIMAANSCTNFTEPQKDRFKSAIIAADKFFNKIGYPQVAAIPWIIAITKGSIYEDGLSHTRENIIFVSDSITETHDNLTKTLIHEKIHIYERQYPEDINKFMRDNGFTRIRRRYGIPRIRANPDLDDWVYLNEITGKELIALYSSDRPHNITDIVLTDLAYEHPYEYLAYKIADLYKS